MEDATAVGEGRNPDCRDRCKVYLGVSQGVIKDVSVEGGGTCDHDGVGIVDVVGPGWQNAGAGQGKQAARCQAVMFLMILRVTQSPLAIRAKRTTVPGSKKSED